MGGVAVATNRDWFEYITSEVRATCRSKGWRYQIRRKWSVRERPVSTSNVDDYEWKLIPASVDSSSDVELAPGDPVANDEGTYFVLGFIGAGKCVLQHDTSRGGDIDDQWFTQTSTVIDLSEASVHERLDASARASLPPQHLLERFLVALTAKFQPNWFSLT